MRIAVGAAVVVAYGWWAVTRRPFSVSATVAVLSAGILAMAWGWRGRRETTPGGRVTGAAWPWALLAGTGGLWQLAAYLQSPRHDHPTLSSLANVALDSTAARTAAFVVWLLGARELARR